VKAVLISTPPPLRLAAAVLLIHRQRLSGSRWRGRERAQHGYQPSSPRRPLRTERFKDEAEEDAEDVEDSRPPTQ
jgi:hypothetical protein